MKKLFALLLAVMILATMATFVSAAELTTTGTTTLTTTVQPASYELNIPERQNITFGETETEIGFATVTGASGFAVGKNIKLTVSYTPFASEDVTTTIPYTLTVWDPDARSVSEGSQELESGDSLVFKGKSSGTVNSVAYIKAFSYNGQSYDSYARKCKLQITSTDWGKALAGEYTATITFATEVVVEN